MAPLELRCAPSFSLELRPRPRDLKSIRGEGQGDGGGDDDDDDDDVFVLFCVVFVLLCLFLRCLLFWCLFVVLDFFPFFGRHVQRRLADRQISHMSTRESIGVN